MSRATESTRGDALSAAADTRQGLTGKAVCPFCGQQKSSSTEPCPRCTMEDTPATRQATKARIGPWYVLQNRSPSAPGMKFSTLLWLISKGQVTPRSIIRGPTTYQLWRWAAHVRGLSREFGLCYSCGGAIEKSAGMCPNCGRSQEPPANPDLLVEARDVAGPRAPIIRETFDRENLPPMPPRQQEWEHEREAANIREYQRMRDIERARESERLRDLQRIREAERTRESEQLRYSLETSAVARQQRMQESMRRGDGSVVSAMELAAAFHTDSQPPNAKRRAGVFRMLAAVLFLAAVGGGTFLLFFPEFREPTLTWMSRTWQSVGRRIAAIDFKNSGKEQLNPPQPVTRNDAGRESQATPATAPSILAAAQPEANVDSGPTITPDKTAAQKSSIPPETTSAAAAEENNVEVARWLWSQAIDAEARQDFATAVRHYEQIEKLPQSAWPGGLKVSLDLARKRAAAQRGD